MLIKTSATPGINSVIKAASLAAKEFNNSNIATEHILYGLALNKNSIAGKILEDYSVSSNEILKIFDSSKNKIKNDQSGIKLTDKAEQIFKTADNIRANRNDADLSTEHLLSAIIIEDNSVATSILKLHFGIEIDEIKERLISDNIITKLENETLKEDLNESKTKTELPEQLISMGSDLTLKAREGSLSDVIGREDEVQTLIETLLKKGKGNPIVVGSPGVGKTSLIYALAIKIAKKDVPSALLDKIIFSLDIGSFMAGTQYRGALEEKLIKAINVLQERDDIILYIDEIHTIMQIGEGGGEVKTADILKPYLEEGSIKVIGSTTFDEYSKYIEKDKAMERRFQKVVVSEPSKENTFEILMGIKSKFESYHNIKITEEILKSIIDLSEKYIEDRKFPDKAIDLLDSCCTNAININDTLSRKINQLLEYNEKLSKESKSLKDELEINQINHKIDKNNREISTLREKLKKDDQGIVISIENILNVISFTKKIPIQDLTKEEKASLINLEDEIKKRIIGQDAAVKAVSQAIKSSRIGIRDDKKPIGTFIFLGQSGVGKTELCKHLARVYFNDESKIIRFDMAEYMDKSSVSNLIGSAKGLVGSEDGGLLINLVKNNPYSIVLFDEMEKADKNIYNILLPVLDEGYIKDSNGNKISFKNTIIIFTSNLGVEELNRHDIKNKEDRDKFLINRMKKEFKPEFLNRIDKTIIFNSLTTEDIAKIAKIMLDDLNKLIVGKGFNPFKITSDAFRYIVLNSKGSGGARSLKRFIEENVSNIINDAILSNNIQKDSEVLIALEEDKIKLVY